MLLAFTIGMHFDTDIALLRIQPKGIVIDYQRLQYKNIHHSEDIENT